MKNIFTTDEVAKICKVAPRTVSKWFDSGRLRGYRIPGSQDRRIPREYLIRFLKEHGFSTNELDEPENESTAPITLFVLMKDGKPFEIPVEQRTAVENELNHHSSARCTYSTASTIRGHVEAMRQAMSSLLDADYGPEAFEIAEFIMKT